MSTEIELCVATAIPEDAESGSVIMDPTGMRNLGVTPDDIVEIEGTSVTAAIVARAERSDLVMGLVRMDGLVRRNAGTRIGGWVKIRKVSVNEAKKVVLAPTDSNVQVQVVGAGLEKLIMGRPLVKGDLISPKQRRKAPSFGDVFSIFEEEHLVPFVNSSGLTFVVANTEPHGVVIVTDMTYVEIGTVDNNKIAESTMQCPICGNSMYERKAVYTIKQKDKQLQFRSYSSKIGKDVLPTLQMHTDGSLFIELQLPSLACKACDILVPLPEKLKDDLAENERVIRKKEQFRHSK